MWSKTRTYLCQTSTVFGQVRQGVERLLGWGNRAQSAPWAEVVTRVEKLGLQKLIAERGLVARIHNGGRGLFRKALLDRSQTSELVAAMRNRYKFRGEFRGVGQRLSAFALVGIAFSSQWYNRDEPQFDPTYADLLAMFGTVKSGSKSAWNVTDVLDAATVSEMKADSSFVLISSPAINSNETCWVDDFDDDGITVLDDDDDNSGCHITQLDDDISDLELEIGDVTDLELQLDKYKPGVDECDLVHSLNCALDLVQRQRDELDSLRVNVSLLNSLLHLLLEQRAPDSLTSLNSSDDISDCGSEEEGVSPGGGLLVVVEGQGQQLRVLRETVERQRQQLIDVLQQTTSPRRTVVTRSSHCKRDACCGPGAPETW
jgi:hypothetical protein